MKVPLRIGAVAEAAGVGVQTLRYYERRGLLSARHRTAGGYREYAPDTVRRVVFIRRAQAMGFTLDEIRALLALRVREPRRCEPVKESADLVIDTTTLNVHELKSKLLRAFADDHDGTRMQVAMESFGFKRGVPIDADIVMDVRFLPNPHWDDKLRPLTGHDPAVRDFVLERAQTQSFLDQFETMLADLLPAYEAEGNSYLTVSIGCTGGRHRSVAVAEELAGRLRRRGVVVNVGHRDLGR